MNKKLINNAATGSPLSQLSAAIWIKVTSSDRYVILLIHARILFTSLQQTMLQYFRFILIMSIFLFMSHSQCVFPGIHCKIVSLGHAHIIPIISSYLNFSSGELCMLLNFEMLPRCFSITMGWKSFWRIFIFFLFFQI